MCKAESFDGANPFHVTGLFQYPLKTSENQRFSDVFLGYRKRPVAQFTLPLLQCIVLNSLVGLFWRSKDKLTEKHFIYSFQLIGQAYTKLLEAVMSWQIFAQSLKFDSNCNNCYREMKFWKTSDLWQGQLIIRRYIFREPKSALNEGWGHLSCAKQDIGMVEGVLGVGFGELECSACPCGLGWAGGG